MIEDYLEKKLNSRVSRHFVDNGFFAKAIKSPQFEGAILGASSIYAPKKQAVFVRLGDGVSSQPVTPQSIARDILGDILTHYGLKRFPYLKNWENYPLLSHPLYWEPYKGKAVLIDLKSAFWAIYSKMPLYVNFWPNEVAWCPWWLYPHLPRDLYQWKLIRNSLPGIWRACESTRIKNGELTRTKNYFPTSCFPNWNFVQRTLHLFAQLALECGAIHIYSDGYIFPDHADWQMFQKMCEVRGFVGEVKQRGDCEVWGLARYFVGERKTKLTGHSTATGNIIESLEWDGILTRLSRENPYYWRSYGTLQEECRKNP